METSQRLGIRALRYFLFRNMFPGVLLVILSIILLALRNIISAEIILLGIIRAPADIIRSAISSLTNGFATMSLFAAALGALLSFIDYYSTSFAYDQFDLRLMFGILNLKEMAIPYRQVQNVNITQSLFMRIFGVGKLEILTAGNDSKDPSNESEGMFDVIDIVLGENMKEKLLNKNSVQLVREVA